MLPCFCFGILCLIAQKSQIQEQLFKIGIKLGTLKDKIEEKELKDEKNEEENDSGTGMNLEKLLQLNFGQLNSKSGLLDEIRDLLAVIRDRINVENVDKFGETIHKLAARSTRYAAIVILHCCTFYLFVFYLLVFVNNIRLGGLVIF